MNIIVNATNVIGVLAFIVFVILTVFMAKEGHDERTQYMKYKLYSFLFTCLLLGLSLVLFITAWFDTNYTMLRVSITTLFSLVIIIGGLYWSYLTQKV